MGLARCPAPAGTYGGREKMLHVDTFAAHQWHCLPTYAGNQRRVGCSNARQWQPHQQQRRWQQHQQQWQRRLQQ